MDRLKGYPGWSVICTVSKENLRHLTKLVDFLHEHEVPTCLMNILRCTLPRSRSVKPDDVVGGEVLLAGAGSHARAVPEDRPQADRGQFRQHPAGDRRPGGAAADVRHFALRRRPLLLRPGPQRRPVPVQRVHRPGAVLRRQSVPRRHPERAPERAVPAGHRPEGRGHRSLPPLCDPAFLRLALSGRGPRDERRHAPASARSASSTKSRSAMPSA